MEHPINVYLNYLVTARTTKTSAALSVYIFVIPRCRLVNLVRHFCAAVGVWNLLPSGVFSGGTLTCFKSAMNLCLLKA